VKVIFIEDVPNVARAGQTREVANGYARNFLFPKKLAVLANSQAASAVEAHLKKVVKARAIEEAEMTALAKQITGVELTLKAKVGENDKLYGSVTNADIAAELTKAVSREIDKRKIDLVEPIRQVGVYDVTVKFMHDITAVVKVTVMSDAEGAERPVKVEKKVEKAEVAEIKKEKAEKPPKEKKEKKAKAPKAEKAAEEVPAAVAEKPAEKAEKPAKEKKAKAEKAEAPVEEKKAEKKEKPAKAEKAPKAEKEEKPAKEEKAEKKPKAKAKKTEDK
jgi:large subunit ribosomal protein L9